MRIVTTRNKVRKPLSLAISALMIATLILSLSSMFVSAASTVSITSPTDLSPAFVQSGGTVDITYDFDTDAVTTETGTTIEDVTIEIYKGLTLVGDRTVSHIVEVGAPHTFATPVTLSAVVPEGSYDVRVVVEDRDGSSTATATQIDAVIVDDTPPAIVSATTTSTTTIDLVFSETLDTETIEAIEFLVAGYTISAAAPAMTTETDDTVELTLTEAMPTGETPEVTYTQGTLADLAGNFVDSFTIVAEDGVAPEVVSIGVSDDVISEVDVNGFTVIVTYGEVMDVGVEPTITFAPDVVDSGTLTFVSGTWSTGDTVYTANYTVADVDEGAEGVDVIVSGGEDLAGNTQAEATKTGAFDVDTVVPTITIVSFPLEFCKNGDTITIVVTTEDGITVTADFSAVDSEYTVGAEAVVEGPSGTYTITYTIDLANTIPDGTYTIPVTATDAAGNTTTEIFSVTLDNTPPSVTEPTATPPAIINDGSDTSLLAANVSDPTSDVALVTINLLPIEGSETQEMYGEEGIYSYETNVPGTVAEGAYDLVITATDGAGNVNATESISLIVDGSAPEAITDLAITALQGKMVLTWTEPSDGGVVSSGLDSYNIYRKTGAEGYTVIGTKDDPATTYDDVDPTLKPGTTYYYVVTAVDVAGNEASYSNEVSETFIAGIPYSITVTAVSPIPADGISTSTITATVLDEWERPVADENVSFATTAGIIWPTWELTNESGTATATLTASTTIENATVTATVVEKEEITDSTTVEFVSSTHDISLNVGWNLISLPLIPVNEDIGVVLAGLDIDTTNIEVVRAYIEGTWNTYVPEAGGTLTTMEDGRGYWVKMKAPAMLTVRGFEQVTPGETPHAYQVYPGWNLIGFKGARSMTRADYLGSVDSIIDVAYGFKHPGGYYPVASGDDLDPGLGYWIAVTREGTISP